MCMRKRKEVKILGTVKVIFGMMINPSSTIKEAVKNTNAYISVLVSALAFGLFFLQTGLDLYKVGQKDFSYVLFSGGVGFAYGLIGVPLIALVSFVLLKALKTEKDVKWAISSFCLSYSGTLVYGVIGLVFSVVFGWRTAVAFGVTGIIWAIGPLIVTAREIASQSLRVGLVLVTFFSTLVLLSWSLFINL